MRTIANEITKTRDQLFEFEKCETAPGRDTTNHQAELEDMQRKHALSADNFRQLAERF